MKNNILLVIISLISLNLYGQLFKPDPEGINYFTKGSELINLGDYKGADSLLTLALCGYKNENVYFNRALSRLYLMDTLGYCQDMDVAANKYLDKQAEYYYNSICCEKVDTIYYDRNYIKSDGSNFRYLEIIKYPKHKYDSVIIGNIHDIKSNKPVYTFDFGCNNNYLGYNSLTTDVIASYVIEDNIKFYFNATTIVSIYNVTAYEDLKRRAKIFMSAKYSDIKTENGNEDLRVYFKVYFDDKGEVLKVHNEGFFPKITYKGNIEELEKDLLDIVKHYPKVQPAKLLKKSVYFMAYDYVEF